MKLFLWSLIVVPFFTLFWMKTAEIKRYMPVALLGTLLSTIINDTGNTLNWWVVHQTVFPLDRMLPYVYGGFPVIILWVFKYLYGNFFRYMLVNAAADLLFAFVINDLFIKAGIYSLVDFSRIHTFLLSMAVAVILYVYQRWQEGIFARRPT